MSISITDNEYKSIKLILDNKERKSKFSIKKKIKQILAKLVLRYS